MRTIFSLFALCLALQASLIASSHVSYISSALSVTPQDVQIDSASQVIFGEDYESRVNAYFESSHYFVAINSALFPWDNDYPYVSQAGQIYVIFGNAINIVKPTQLSFKVVNTYKFDTPADYISSKFDNDYLIVVNEDIDNGLVIVNVFDTVFNNFTNVFNYSSSALPSELVDYTYLNGNLYLCDEENGYGTIYELTTDGTLSKIFTSSQIKQQSFFISLDSLVQPSVLLFASRGFSQHSSSYIEVIVNNQAESTPSSLRYISNINNTYFLAYNYTAYTVDTCKVDSSSGAIEVVSSFDITQFGSPGETFVRFIFYKQENQVLIVFGEHDNKIFYVDRNDYSVKGAGPGSYWDFTLSNNSRIRTFEDGFATFNGEEYVGFTSYKSRYQKFYEIDQAQEMLYVADCGGYVSVFDRTKNTFEENYLGFKCDERRGEVIGVKYLGAGKAVVTFAEGYDTISYFDGSQTYQVHPTRGDFGIVETFVHGEILSAVSYDQHGGNFYLDQYNYKTGASVKSVMFPDGEVRKLDEDIALFVFSESDEQVKIAHVYQISTGTYLQNITLNTADRVFSLTAFGYDGTSKTLKAVAYASTKNDFEYVYICTNDGDASACTQFASNTLQPAVGYLINGMGGNIFNIAYGSRILVNETIYSINSSDEIIEFLDDGMLIYE